MNRKQLKWRLYLAWQYFPFTLNTLLCAVAAWAAFKILYKPLPKGEDPSPFLPFVILMGKLTVWFLASLIFMSILSTFVSYFYFLWLRHRKGTQLDVRFYEDDRPGKRKRMYLEAALAGAIRPFLGFVKGRLWYDNDVMTDSFALLTNRRKQNSFKRTAIAGKSRLYLPDIKEYELKGGFVYFQDMLHLFSLAVSQPLSGHFFKAPVLQEQEEKDASPKKTDTMDVRIDQLRRVEGEYLNYKDFESGDDVRRIVWKVYARNRELVVRVPEMYEPYASHLHLYISFYAAVKPALLGNAYMKEMLNYYKNCTWTVYATLVQKEWGIRYLPDQSFSVHEPDEQAATARIISNSGWHRDRPLLGYFDPRTGSVLCISSFTDPKELDEVLEKCDKSTVIYFVRTSAVLRSFAPAHWLARILFTPPADRLSRLRARWALSPLRRRVLRQEKEIVQLLQQHDVTWAEL